MIGQGGGNGFQLRQGASRLGSRKKFCTQRLGMHWNSLPEEVVDAPSLEAFKPRLDVALGSLVRATGSGWQPCPRRGG